VVPAYRHLGIARELISRLLIQAQHLDYQSVRLDTLPTMTGAQTLYHAMGFVPIDAYRYNPVPGTLYLEHFFNPKTH
jgi:carbonic anhydrase